MWWSGGGEKEGEMRTTYMEESVAEDSRGRHRASWES